MNTKLTSKKFMIMLFVIIGALVFLGSVVGSALAADNSPFSVVYAKEGYENAGPDALYEIPSWGLLCIDDNGETRCYCKCASGACEAKDGTLVPVATLPGSTVGPTSTPGTGPSLTPGPTATGTPTTTQAPTTTPIPPKPTPTTPVYNGRWVWHYNQHDLVPGQPTCKKNWQGHVSHPGHLHQDIIGGECIAPPGSD